MELGEKIRGWGGDFVGKSFAGFLCFPGGVFFLGMAWIALYARN